MKPNDSKLIPILGRIARGYYEVDSDVGCLRKKGKRLGTVGKDGYVQLVLSVDGVKLKVLEHRLLYAYYNVLTKWTKIYR